MDIQEVRDLYTQNFKDDPEDLDNYVFYGRPILYKFKKNEKTFIAQLITNSSALEETLIVEVNEDTLKRYEQGCLLLYDLYKNSENDLIVFQEYKKSEETDQPHLEIKFYNSNTLPLEYLPAKNADLMGKKSNHVYIWIDFETEGLDLDKHLPLSFAYIATNSYGEILKKGQQSFIKNNKYNCDPKAFKVHQITENFIQEYGETPLEVIQKFNLYLNDIIKITKEEDDSKDCKLILAGQSVHSFDKPMLTKLCDLAESPKTMNRFSRRLMELESLSMFLFNDQNPGLDGLLKKFQLSRPQKHDALEDIKATIELFNKYLRMI